MRILLAIALFAGAIFWIWTLGSSEVSQEPLRTESESNGKTSEETLDLKDVDSSTDLLPSPISESRTQPIDGSLVDVRDELFVHSPRRPKPGDYEVPFLQERYENGKLYFEAQQAQDQNGIWLLHGLWTAYYENGEKQEEGWYDMNREIGEWRWWDENGQLVAQGSFLLGKREGPWTLWYSNGTKQADSNYHDGDGFGPWTLYYDNGQPWAQGQYLNGEIAGYWTIWDEFGEINPERTGIYENGMRVSD